LGIDQSNLIVFSGFLAVGMMIICWFILDFAHSHVDFYISTVICLAISSMAYPMVQKKAMEDLVKLYIPKKDSNLKVK